MSEKPNILKHEGQIWAISDTYRSVGIVDQEVPKMMMPFFALLMVDSRMVRAATEKKEELRAEGLSEEDIIEEMMDTMTYYNSMIIDKNTSLKDICENDTNFNQNLEEYLRAYDSETRALLGINSEEGELEYLNIRSAISKLKQKKILFSTIRQWSMIPFELYNNSEITTLEEHIKRKWADISAGQFYTPSDVIELIQKIIKKHHELNPTTGFVRIYDPTCGGGNMLFGIEDRLREQDPSIKIQSYGQEIEDSLYALSKIESRFRNESFIKLGNTLTTDEFENEKFDYTAANPPYGYSWGDHQKEIKERGSVQGCFLDNYPSTSDGQLLFLQHIIHKMKDNGYAVVVSNGSPLFSGDAGSGESEIRKWILDNNYLEALIQLPKELFYNTKISTYLWVLNKNKAPDNTKIKIIDASSMSNKLSKNKGDKAVEVDETGQQRVVDILFDVDNECKSKKDDICREFDREYFYFNKQEVMLHHKDVNGKSIYDFNESMQIISNSLTEEQKKLIKKHATKGPLNIVSISTRDKEKEIILKDGEPFEIKNLEEIEGESLKDKNKRIQDYLKSIEEDNLIIESTGDPVGNDKKSTFQHTYNGKKETIVQENKFTGEVNELGNGTIKVTSSYKKATKTQEEKIEIKVYLSPKYEKDYEIIPFQEYRKGEIIINDVDEFLAKWVEKDFEKLENRVGVEINFNKIFYKYEKLRNVDEIFADIKKLEKEESELDNDIFDLSPIELSADDLKELED